MSSYLREYAAMLQAMADEMVLIAEAEEKQHTPALSLVTALVEAPAAVTVQPEAPDEVGCRSVYKMSPTTGKEGITRYIKNELLRSPEVPIGLELVSGRVIIIRSLDDLNEAMKYA